MASLNAAAVAHKVLEKVRKGEKINYGEVIASQGYGRGISTHPNKVTGTKSYKAVMIPVIKQMEVQRQRMIDALANKDLDDEKVAVLVGSIDILTKNVQLLSGGATANVALSIEISEAVSKKNGEKGTTEKQG